MFAEAPTSSLIPRSVRDKVRIIALYILYRDGVPDEDRKRLYQHARLGMPEVDAVNNLARLGQEVAKDSSKKRKQLFKQTIMEEAYDISRFQPAIKLMLEVRPISAVVCDSLAAGVLCWAPRQRFISLHGHAYGAILYPCLFTIRCSKFAGAGAGRITSKYAASLDGRLQVESHGGTKAARYCLCGGRHDPLGNTSGLPVL
jgi:hypothetical protein